jgi:hypothetical protein
MANTIETISLPVAAAGDVGKPYTASELVFTIPEPEMDRFTRLRVGLINAGATLADGTKVKSQRSVLRYILQQIT